MQEPPQRREAADRKPWTPPGAPRRRRIFPPRRDDFLRRFSKNRFFGKSSKKYKHMLPNFRRNIFSSAPGPKRSKMRPSFRRRALFGHRTQGCSLSSPSPQGATPLKLVLPPCADGMLPSGSCRPTCEDIKTAFFFSPLSSFSFSPPSLSLFLSSFSLPFPFSFPLPPFLLSFLLSFFLLSFFSLSLSLWGGGGASHFKQELENDWPVIFQFCLKLGWSMLRPGPPNYK